MNLLSSTRQTIFSIALLGSAACACGDRCLTSDYAPPSARFALRDAVTGAGLCSARDLLVTTSIGDPIAHEDACEWWLPEWIAPPEIEASATAAEVTVTVAGYTAETVVLDVRRNDCGEIQRPPLQQLEVTPE